MTKLEELRVKIADLESGNEDYPNEINEFRQSLILRYALEAADEILMEATANAEELNYLTSALALEFMKKAHCVPTHALMRKQLLQEIERNESDF